MQCHSRVYDMQLLLGAYLKGLMETLIYYIRQAKI